MIQDHGEGPGSSDPGFTLTPRQQQIWEFFRSHPDLLTDHQIRDTLQIPESSVRTRLDELNKLGLIEPTRERNKAGRQHWRVAAPEHRQAVAAQAVNRQKQRAFRQIENEPLWLKGWLVERLLDPHEDPEAELRLLEEPCPGMKVASLCDCNSVNVWVTRHRKSREARRSRASQTANELRRLRRAHRLAMEAAQKEDPTAIQYLTYKGYIREASVYLAHMAGFVTDEIEFKQESGYSELSDQKWLDIRDMVVGDEGVQVSVDELRVALDRLIDDDVIDVEEISDYDDNEIMDAEILELEPGE